MNNLIKDLLIGLQPAHLVTLILQILLAGCDCHGIPSDVRKSLNLAGGNKNELLEVDSIRFHSRTTFTVEPDIRFIDAGYLIDNIDLAYQAYSMIPEHLKYNQDVFMRFVLPYRNLNEPIEAGLRRYFFTRYHWVFERMHQYDSLQQAACDLLDSLNISFHHLYRYPFVMPLSNCYRIRLGNSCDSMVNLAVFIFRSLGIPVAYDYTPIWPVGAGNLGKGHAWLAFLLNDTVYGVDIPDKALMNRLYKHEVLPKIYRRTYEKNQTSCFFPNSLDVTNQYRNTVNVPVNQRENTGKSLLNVFNSVRGWVSIDESVNQRGNHYFGDVGKNIVYAISESSGHDQEMTETPFYINSTGEILHLAPDYDHRIRAILTRKYNPFEIRYLNKIEWTHSITGAEIQAANKTDFSDAVSLVRIENFNSSNKRLITTSNTRAYLNYRLVSPDSTVMHLCGFHLLKEQEVIITEWQVHGSGQPVIHDMGYLVIDQDPLTYISDKYLTVSYYFDKPVVISEFMIQARNDDNNVKPGCVYELMYWDGGWKSAGSKQATDTLLVFENIPSGALYWLRNHTEGIQEQVFLLDEQGYQYWPGVSSFKDSYHEFFELESFCPG